MDATCAIQDSIHVFSLVRKYVSRILGTYQTITEALFDIVVSKPDELDFVRFGAGDDWQVKY